MKQVHEKRQGNADYKKVQNLKHKLESKKEVDWFHGQT